MGTNGKAVPTAVYCDGGMIPDGGPIHSRSTLGGTYAWVLVNAPQGVQVMKGGGLILPSQYGTPDITNNVAEMVAMLNAMEAWPEGVQGILYSDSEVTVNRVFGNWKLEGLPPALIGWLRRIKRGPKVDLLSPELVGGHPTIRDLARGHDGRGRPVSPWNVLVDRECNRFAQQYLANNVEGRMVEHDRGK